MMDKLNAQIRPLSNISTYTVLQSSSDHTLLLVSIIIEKEFIQERKQSIVRNNKKSNLSINLETAQVILT